MKITHITRVQYDGRHIPITLVQERKINGDRLASSFHGWLTDNEVTHTLKRYREIDKQQEKFNG